MIHVLYPRKAFYFTPTNANLVSSGATETRLVCGCVLCCMSAYPSPQSFLPPNTSCTRVYEALRQDCVSTLLLDNTPADTGQNTNKWKAPKTLPFIASIGHSMTVHRVKTLWFCGSSSSWNSFRGVVEHSNISEGHLTSLEEGVIHSDHNVESVDRCFSKWIQLWLTADSTTSVWLIVQKGLSKISPINFLEISINMNMLGVS